MSILTETYTMSNGVEIPKLGLGTWFIDDAVVPGVVSGALDMGYRNVDTAQAYENERGVGEGLRASGLDRDEIFVSTKLAAEIKTYDEEAAAIDGSLAKLGLDVIDLMLIHSPQPWDDFRGGDYAEGNLEAWRALEDAYDAGKLRAIGVSNFREADIQNILDNGRIAPHANQILVHAGNTPSDLIAFCQEHSIVVQAYSPIAHGSLLESPTLKEMAARYGVSVAQLCIRYVIQLGTVALPKSANLDHVRSNSEVEFVISDADMAALKELNEADYGEYSAFPVFSGK